MSWERPDAWRDSYDEWKLRSPYDDYVEDDEPPEEERPYIHQRRHTLRQEAERATDGNPAAIAAKELRRAGDWRRRVAIYSAELRLGLNGRDPERQSRGIRHHIAEARRLRTFIGPPCPDDMMPF